MDKQHLSRLSVKGNITGYYFLFFIIVSFLTSCVPTKNTYYFKTLRKDTTISGLVNKDLESKITKADNLAIAISSLNKEEDPLFNTGTLPGSPATAASFLVDKDGFVTIHKLGNIKAEGLTRKEFAALLQKELAPYLKDPIVTVQYLNHKITILGEVQKPQVLNMPEEQLSLIDVLALSGDIKENAVVKDIMIIRENGNQKQVKHVNLEDHSIFTSPWYYVQPNDIVVVTPDFEQRDREQRRTRIQTNIAIATSTISLLIILLDRIIR